MSRFIGYSIKFLWVSLVLQATISRAWHTTSQSNSEKRLRLARTPAVARSLYEQFSLGEVTEGAKIIYTHQYTQTYEEAQQEIALDFNYPSSDENAEEDDNSPAIITQIHLYVKTQNSSGTQAYLTQGGIGYRNVSLQIVASNTNLLNCMLVIYGREQYDQ